MHDIRYGKSQNSAWLSYSKKHPQDALKEKKKSHLKLVDEDTSWLGDNINGQFWEDKGTPAPNEGSIVSWAGLTQSFRRIL